MTRTSACCCARARWSTGCSAGGPAAKLVSWLWQGWGFTSWDPAAREPVIAATVRGMRDRLPEPWMLIAGTGHYLPYLERLGVLDRTVYLPYGAIEAEPSLPFTNVEPEAVRGAIEGAARFPGLAGFMGNVQCPLLQLPQATMMEGLWGRDTRFDRQRRAARSRPAAPPGRGFGSAVATAMTALNATEPAPIEPRSRACATRPRGVRDVPVCSAGCSSHGRPRTSSTSCISSSCAARKPRSR